MERNNVLEQIKTDWPDWANLPEKFINNEIESRMWWMKNFNRVPFTDLRCHTCGGRIPSGDFANVCSDCYTQRPAEE